MLNNQFRMALKLPTIALLALGFVCCSPLNSPGAVAAETKETKIAKDTKDECDVTCVDPHAACVESQ